MSPQDGFDLLCPAQTANEFAMAIGSGLLGIAALLAAVAYTVRTIADLTARVHVASHEKD